MQYVITRLVIGEGRSIAISKEEFQSILTAQDRITTILGIEQKLELLLWNFAEYESELLRLALYHSIWVGSASETLDDGWSSVNRRVLNLLAAVRMYLDQVRHEMSEMYGKDSSVYETLTRSISAQYDSVLAFRAMEGLRNHAQHRSLPLGTLSLPMSIHREAPAVKFCFSAVPALDLEQLQYHGAIKPVILDELRAMSEKPNLTELLRRYLSCITVIHGEFRRLSDPDVTSWAEVIRNVAVRAREAFDNDIIGLGVASRDEGGWNVDYRYLWEDTLSQRQLLLKKNRVPTDFANRYVSSELDSD